MKKLALLSWLFIPVVLFSQDLVQQIRGRVVDRESRLPLQGAFIGVEDSLVKVHTTTDSAGYFILKAVPVGRWNIACSYVGYASFLSDGVIVNAAKALEMVIELDVAAQKESDVVVKGVRNPKLPANPLSVVSTRSFNPEETQRYAASVNDPGRLVMSFPGVQPTRDVRADIIVRGNNPLGVQWRLEGIDIPNPNHFARKGSSGGGISMLSIAMLGNSDFSSGAFAAEYGDALSAVFDMRLRSGNNQHSETTLKAGMIGLEVATEGPLKKGGASYLVNYRYSTLGLLGAMGLHLVGERENNAFTDLSFNFSFPNARKTSNTNLWAVMGYSKETYDPVADVNEWQQYDDYSTYDNRTRMLTSGITHDVNIGTHASLRTTAALMYQQVTWIDDTLNKQMQPFTVNDEAYGNARFTLSSVYNHKWSSRAFMKAGIYLNYLGYDMTQDKYDFNTGKYGNVIQGEGNSWQAQPFVQVSLKPHPRVTVNAGLHAIYLGMNETASLEPRLSAQWKAGKGSTWSASFGRHGKVLPLGNYFYNSGKADAPVFPNQSLDIMQANHLVLAWDKLLKGNWRLHAEGYGQWLEKIPVVADNARTFWYLNTIEGYIQETVVSQGKGKNIGLDLMAEKFFSKGWFVLTSFSVFNSTFSPLNAQWYNTQWNSRSSGSLAGAKEWGLKQNKVFQLGLKTLYNGGLTITPLMPGAPQNDREPVLDESRPYEDKVPPFFRTDLRLALRRDKAKLAWQLALDVQNVFGIKNTDALERRYDPSVNQWVYQSLSSVVPVLSYQIDF